MSETKRALITGITGQDGSYLAELLLSKGYEVHGLIRRASTFNTTRIEHLYVDPHDPEARLFLHYGDLSDAGQLTNLIYNLQPQEIYHLAAQSHVRVSFDVPEYTGRYLRSGLDPDSGGHPPQRHQDPFLSGLLKRAFRGCAAAPE